MTIKLVHFQFYLTQQNFKLVTYNILYEEKHRCFPGGSEGKESVYNAGDLGLIPGLGRSPTGGHSNTLQYSCLENLTDRGAWLATVHRVAQFRTQWSSLAHMQPEAQGTVCLLHAEENQDSYIFTCFKAMPCRLNSQPGIEPVHPPWVAWSVNHWTARKIPEPLHF